MITIFHGENTSLSKKKLQEKISKIDSRWIDGSNLNINTASNLLEVNDLFGNTKTIVISNYFNIKSRDLSQISTIIKNKSTDIDIYMWQSKKLTLNQIKMFPDASVHCFNKSNSVFDCIYSLKPGNTNQFIVHYQNVVEDNMFDLFLYLVKKEVKKKISNPKYKKTYLSLIELDLLNKTGKLAIKKETALKRTLLPITKKNL